MTRRRIGDLFRVVANWIDPPRPIHVVLKVSPRAISDSLRSVWRDDD